MERMVFGAPKSISTQSRGLGDRHAVQRFREYRVNATRRSLTCSTRSTSDVNEAEARGYSAAPALKARSRGGAVGSARGNAAGPHASSSDSPTGARPPGPPQNRRPAGGTGGDGTRGGGNGRGPPPPQPPQPPRRPPPRLQNNPDARGGDRRERHQVGAVSFRKGRVAAQRRQAHPPPAAPHLHVVARRGADQAGRSIVQQVQRHPFSGAPT